MAENLVKSLIKADKSVKNVKVAILGFTFKENCPDTRNTKVFDIVKELREYGIVSVIVDPIADAAEAKSMYGIDFVELDAISGMDTVVVAVAHSAFAALERGDVDKLYGEGKKVLLDLKGLYSRKEYEAAGYSYWRL